MESQLIHTKQTNNRHHIIQQQHQDNDKIAVYMQSRFCPPLLLQRDFCSYFFLSFAVTSTSVVCHQRALSLPSADPILTPNTQMGNANASTSFHNNNNISNNFNNNMATSTPPPPPPSYNTFSTSTIGRLTKQNNRNSSHIMFNHSILSSCSNNNTSIANNLTIQPVHHRTRSLPLTEETAIQISTLPPPLPFGQANKRTMSHKCFCQCNKNSSLCALHNGLNNNDRSSSSLLAACSSTSVSYVDGGGASPSNNNFHQEMNSSTSILQSLTAAAAADEARAQATNRSSKDQEYLFMESNIMANGVGHMEPDYVNCNNNLGSCSKVGGKNVSPQLLHRNRNASSVRCMYIFLIFLSLI
jgi:hypothetical protein